MRAAITLAVLLSALSGGCSHDAQQGPDPTVARAVEAAVDRSLPYDFVVRADIVAEEAGAIRCASRVLATAPADARSMTDVQRAYLVAACAGRTEQAVAQHVPPVCLVVPVVATAGRGGSLSFTVLDGSGDRLRRDVAARFPRAARADALRAPALARPLWRRLGQDPAKCGR